MAKKIGDYKVGDVIKLRPGYDKNVGITPGKIYIGEIVVDAHGKTHPYLAANIPDDDDFLMYCLIGTGCAHINDNEWEIVEDD